MKSKKIKKLGLKKLTVANLEKDDLKKAQGGYSSPLQSCWETMCSCPCVFSVNITCAAICH